MKKSKKFRVAREGATTDGRKISRDWIVQMAKNYDPKLYGARVNLEHFKGILPDGPFKAYGDVLSLSTEEETGVMYLRAEISPTDDLVEMNQKRQKVYTSIEVNPAFADTGEAYMVGLAVTDNPASLGNEMLEFSSKAKINPLGDRKIDKDNLFTEAFEVNMEFFEEEDKPSLGDKIKAMFSAQKKAVDGDYQKFRDEVEGAISLMVTQLTSLQDDFAQLKKQGGRSADLDKLQAEFKSLQDKLEKNPVTQTHRSKATGSDGQIETDC